jgi:hypothetical protein
MPGLIQGFDPSKKGLWTLKLQNSLFSIASKGLEQDKENWQRTSEVRDNSVQVKIRTRQPGDQCVGASGCDVRTWYD